MEVVSGGQVALSCARTPGGSAYTTGEADCPEGRGLSLDFLPSSEKAVCSLQAPLLSAPPLVFLTRHFPVVLL